MLNPENTREVSESVLNWAPDAPKGGKAVMNRVLKDGASVPLFFAQTLIASLRLVVDPSERLRRMDGLSQAAAATHQPVLRSSAMVNQDQINAMMRNFPPEAELLRMSAEDVGMHLLKYMTRGRAETNRFNFLQMVPGGQVAFRFMEGWGGLLRQGFLAPAPNDMYGQNHFVTRAGEAVAQQDDLDAWRKAHLFPDYFDTALQRWVKPLFARGDYDTAVFRAFKEVETRVRKKSGFKTDYGRGLMLKAFGETGPLMAGDAEGRKAARELFAGAISFCKNPSSHHEIDFDDAREVVDMISFANQLLRIVDRL